MSGLGGCPTLFLPLQLAKCTPDRILDGPRTRSSVGEGISRVEGSVKPRRLKFAEYPCLDARERFPNLWYAFAVVLERKAAAFQYVLVGDRIPVRVREVVAKQRPAVICK